METLDLDLPSLYGDHHVLEIRRILLGMPGVEEVYASSCFQLVQVNYDPLQVTGDGIRAALDEAGYLQDVSFPTEVGAAPRNAPGSAPYFRHSAANEQIKQVVSFAQNVAFSGRPLWPCPGIGVIEQTDEGNHNG